LSFQAGTLANDINQVAIELDGSGEVGHGIWVKDRGQTRNGVDEHYVVELGSFPCIYKFYLHVSEIMSV
jgi:hypothetical protein